MKEMYSVEFAFIRVYISEKCVAETAGFMCIHGLWNDTKLIADFGKYHIPILCVLGTFYFICLQQEGFEQYYSNSTLFVNYKLIYKELCKLFNTVEI